MMAFDHRSSFTPPLRETNRGNFTIATPADVARGSRQRFLFSLLSTPVGYGKSILMAQYAANLKTSWAWLRCDSGDNRPLNLLLHLHHAIGLSMPAPGINAANEETLWAEIIGE